MAPFNQPLLPVALPDPDLTRLARAIAQVRACEAALVQAVAQLRALLADVTADAS